MHKISAAYIRLNSIKFAFWSSWRFLSPSEASEAPTVFPERTRRINQAMNFGFAKFLQMEGRSSVRFSMVERTFETASKSSFDCSSLILVRVSIACSGSCSSISLSMNPSGSGVSLMTSVKSLSTFITSTAMSVLTCVSRPRRLARPPLSTNSGKRAGVAESCASFLISSSRSTSDFKNLSGSSWCLILISWFVFLFLSSWATTRFKFAEVMPSTCTVSACLRSCSI
mmetsp:Transcript_39338/g.77407  ORF Transcript_39338/g.77407 Transcript_39338/m.77407 type:complete len:227 (-) Transcript_39338:434-1114(-)